LEQNIVSSTDSVVAELQQLTGVASVVPKEGPEALELQAKVGETGRKMPGVVGVGNVWYMSRLKMQTGGIKIQLVTGI
jgi:hypothetical protein